MSDTFYIKRGDTAPALLYQLAPVLDLTGCTVVFNMRPKGSTTAKVSRGAASVYGTATNGQVRYDWASGDTDTSGYFEGEFEVTLTDGSIETYPNYGYIPITVTEDIA